MEAIEDETAPVEIEKTSVEYESFKTQDNFSDITLIVEDQKLFTSRAILASASPVWRRMFVSDLKERDAREIPLPGKRCEDVLEMLLCITPATMKPIAGDNIDQVLPLFDEYQMERQKQDCERWLLSQLEDHPSPDELMRYLVLSQTYNLGSALTKAVQLVSEFTLDELEQHPQHPNIEAETMVDILKVRVRGNDLAKTQMENEIQAEKEKNEAARKELENEYKEKIQNLERKLTLMMLRTCQLDFIKQALTELERCCSECEYACSGHNKSLKGGECKECSKKLLEFIRRAVKNIKMQTH